MKKNKCPKCGKELRQSKKEPEYLLCDGCKVKYNNPKYRAEKPKEKGKKINILSGMITFLFVTLLVVGLYNFFSPSDSEKEVAAETDKNGWTTHDYAEFQMVTEKMSNDFVTNYKTSSNIKDWTFAKLDDDGNVIVNTKFSFDGIAEKQEVFCVFHLDGDKMLGHYLSIGGKVYIDDGTCDDVFDKLAELAG